MNPKGHKNTVPREILTNHLSLNFMDLLKFLFNSSPKMVVSAIFIGFLSGASSAALIALIGFLLEHTAAFPMSYFIVAFMGLAFITLFTSWLVRVILIRLSQKAVFQLQMNLSRQILLTQLSYVERLGSPLLLANLTEDIQAIANAVYVLPFMFINVAIVTSCLIYIAWLSWQVFLVTIGLGLLTSNSIKLLLNKGKRFLALAREDQDSLFQHFRTLTEGIKELKLHYQKRQDFLNDDLQITATQFRHHNVKGLSLLAATDSSGKLIFFLAIAFILFILPQLIKVNYTSLASYVLIFTYILGPLENLVNKLPIVSKANIALQKITSIGFSLTSHAETPTIPLPIKADWQSLKIKGITHTYSSNLEDKNFTLGPINLNFYPQEIVFIVGGNGSGKSSFAKLLTGLYIPEMGEIYLDKCLITSDNLEWYRQHFSVIFADFYLFKRLLGLDYTAIETQIDNYLKLLQLEKKVTIEQGKFSTTALSQGQRKRLALLAVYLEDRPIYLFDEWAADQDPTFKHLFYTEFLGELKNKGKLVIVISHDDRYFHLADRIIKFDSGQVEFDHPSTGKHL